MDFTIPLPQHFTDTKLLQQWVRWLKADKNTRRIIAELEGDGTSERIDGFAASLLQAYAPRIHAYYQQTLQTIYEAHPHLKTAAAPDGNPIPNPGPGPHTFAAKTGNLGYSSATAEHLDHANLAWGMCAIISKGKFNPDEGGHLVLHDLGLIIRFPPGSVILIPSAILRHSNIGVPEGQTRFSTTLYSAGGLFRWVYNGCKTDKTVLKDLTEEMRQKRESDRLARWENGLQMFSTLSELA